MVTYTHENERPRCHAPRTLGCFTLNQIYRVICLTLRASSTFYALGLVIEIPATDMVRKTSPF